MTGSPFPWGSNVQEEAKKLVPPRAEVLVSWEDRGGDALDFAVRVTVADGGAAPGGGGERSPRAPSAGAATLVVGDFDSDRVLLRKASVGGAGSDGAGPSRSLPGASPEPPRRAPQELNLFSIRDGARFSCRVDRPAADGPRRVVTALQFEASLGSDVTLLTEIADAGGPGQGPPPAPAGGFVADAAALLGGGAGGGGGGAPPAGGGPGGGGAGRPRGSAGPGRPPAPGQGARPLPT